MRRIFLVLLCLSALIGQAAAEYVIRRSLSNGGKAGQPDTRVNCQQYPYGDDPWRVDAFLKEFSKLGNLEKILSGACRSKFNQNDRAGMHNLKIYDREIDSSPVSDLAMKVVSHLWCSEHNRPYSCIDAE